LTEGTTTIETIMMNDNFITRRDKAENVPEELYDILTECIEALAVAEQGRNIARKELQIYKDAEWIENYKDSKGVN
jgi:hypothetical protein